MEQLNSIPAIQAILRKGIESGRWTLEDLDKPSYGFREMTRVDRATFKFGYEGVQHRNLLRPDSDTPKHPEANNPTSRTQDTHPSQARPDPDPSIPF